MCFFRSYIVGVQSLETGLLDTWEELVKMQDISNCESQLYTVNSKGLFTYDVRQKRRGQDPSPPLS